MDQIIKNHGSFKDPAGSIFEYNGRIIREVRKFGKTRYEFIKDSGILKDSIEKGFLVKTKEVSDLKNEKVFSNSEYLLEHDIIPFISYPYEWNFYQLQAAALHHLDFQIFLLNKGAVLIDANAYNIQFIGNKPIFIDILSIDEYKEGSYWVGHKQFCEHFLNPLLLKSKKGINFNNWYRGNFNGIDTDELNSLLTFYEKFSYNIFFHVTMLSRLDKKTVSDPKKTLTKLKKVKSFSKNSYLALLLQLRNWIKKLEIKKTKTIWGNYSEDNSYDQTSMESKLNIVKNFINKTKPNLLADLGCNDGKFSEESLKNGCRYVIGFDFDLNSVEKAYFKLKDKSFLPLYFDASNPSSNIGWDENERLGFNKRASFDALIALAFEHHLSVAKNIPLKEVVSWLVNIAPKGLIEFVPKDDPTVQQMLSLKGDIFKDYNEENFRKYILEHKKIYNENNIKGSKRIIFEYGT